MAVPLPLHRWWWLRNWIPTFLAFPLGGLATRLLVGPVDTTLNALVGGLLVGTAVGGFQYTALRRFEMSAKWILATAAGGAAGSVLSGLIVGFGTDLFSLLSRGVVTGMVLGVAQAVAVRRPPREAILWASVNSAMWGVAWWISSLVIRDDVESNYAVFGSSGAIALTVVLLRCLSLVVPAFPSTQKERP